MRRSGNILILLILIVAGLIIGSFIGDLLANYVNVFAYSKSIGFDPVTVDLAFVKFTIGLIIQMNLASVIGLFVGILVYKWI